ncbi:MAG: MBL fold metallo-hydrolase [Phycisphaerae bacterium]
MIAIALQSGSKGNCYYIEAAGKRLIFDAGISLKRVRQRLGAVRKTITGVDAIFISHDHSDHCRNAGVLHRGLKAQVHASEGTVRSLSRKTSLGKIAGYETFRAGASVDVGDVHIETLPTTHDGNDGVAFIIEAEGKRLGILTDLGCVFEGLGDCLADLDAVFLESNYDPHMLANGPYPWYLQQRISGSGGHLSNIEAAELLLAVDPRRFEWVVLSHLSEENNTPDTALRTHVETHGFGDRLLTAGRLAAVGPLTL